MDTSKQEIEKNITLSQFILKDMQRHPEATGQFTILLHSIEIACKYISSKVRAAGNDFFPPSLFLLFAFVFALFSRGGGNAGLLNLYGAEGSTNVQGEVVKKLDVVSNEAFTSALRRSHTVNMMVSEENEQPILIENSVGMRGTAFLFSLSFFKKKLEDLPLLFFCFCLSVRLV
jgi:fructose-1,6-bisphosphatase I